MNCLHCHAETSNGLALCELCQRKVTLDLEFLPVYFRNLARWRPGRAGSRPVPGSRVLYDGTVRGTGPADPVSLAVAEAGADLVGWAESLADDRPEIRWPLDLADLEEAPQAERLCQLLTDMLITIATLEWAGEFVRAMGTHEANLRYHTERAVPGWYAGACRRRITMEANCGAPTYVVPGLTWVTCGACGSTTYARDHLETILDEARGWVARPMRIAEAIVALVDTEQSVPRLHKRISKWGERGQVRALRQVDIDGDEVGPKRFRLGEVLDVLLTEGATRLGEADEVTTRVS